MKQKTTMAINHRMNFLCDDFPKLGGSGIPQCEQLLSPTFTIPPQCLQMRPFIDIAALGGG